MKRMTRETYLSTMLTVVATLLTIDVGTRLAADPPTMVATATAQTAPKAPQQRRAMISLLEALTGEVKALRTDLKKGGIKVKVSESVKR